jgi:hypothetical protein
MSLQPTKEQKPARELRALIMAEVAKHAACGGIQGVGILWPEPPDWDVAWLRQEGTKPNPECERLLEQFVAELQAKYELALEAQPTLKTGRGGRLTPLRIT